MTERIRLSDHFTYTKLFRFVLPSIAMMIFISIYGIVDGFFVSNYAGELAFAGLNLIYPFVMILVAVGFMLGAGGNAAVSKMLGEGNGKEANRIFSMLIYATLLIGAALAVIGMIVVRPIAEFLASMEKNLASEERAQLVENSVTYARIVLSALPLYITQNAFQNFFVTAEKPRLGLYVTVGAGVMNMLLDALFVAGFSWGIVGAALATGIAQCVGGVLPLFYFGRKNDSLLRLVKTNFNGKVFIEICVNGLSELITNISLSVVTILFNAQLMRYIGLNGVNAYGIMMYLGFIFIAVFIGYAIGGAPIIGFHYGAENRSELKNILKKSVISLSIAGIAMTVICILFAQPLSHIFVPEDRELLQLTARGLTLYSLGFLLTGLNIFVSSFFTALSNGALSLLISFFRTFLCQVIAVLVLPLFLGVDGIWLASVVAELVTLALSVFVIYWKRKKYGYL